MYTIKKKKVFSMLLVLLLMLQLLPLGTALATSTESSEGIFDVGDPLLTGDSSALDTELDTEFDTEPTTDAEELEGSISPFASGGGSGVRDDLTGTEYLNIHDQTGTNPTVIVIKDKLDNTILPDSSGNYSNIPEDATLQFKLGFHLADGPEDESATYSYSGTEFFDYTLPSGIPGLRALRRVMWKIRWELSLPPG
ncbi:MAG: hypothetical protein AAGU32_20640 [Bacillota bacterium]